MAQEQAWTAPGSHFPPYCNVKLLDDGTVRVIVRSERQQDGYPGATGQIILSRDVYESVFGTITDAVRGEEKPSE